MNQISSVTLLSKFAVDKGFYGNLPCFKLGLDAWSHRGKAIETFGSRPLAIFLLKVPSGYVIKTSITKNIVISLSYSYFRCPSFYHYCQLTFIVNPLRKLGVDDIFIWPDDRCGRF